MRLLGPILEAEETTVPWLRVELLQEELHLGGKTTNETH